MLEYHSPYLPFSAWPFVASEVIVLQSRCPIRYQRPTPNAIIPGARSAAEYREEKRGDRLAISSEYLNKKWQSHGEQETWDLKLEESFILLVGYLGT